MLNRITFAFLLWIIILSAYAAQSSVDRGQALFLSYCNGCHTLQYTNLPKVSMPHSEAKKWFKILPPDLTLVAKYRGKNWLEDYLQGFYYDAERPYKCNNKLLPNVLMPNVLYPLESHSDYLQNIEDIANFLDYVAEPYRSQSYKLGALVVVFLLVIWILFYRKYGG